jgi:hypothetical protein
MEASLYGGAYGFNLPSCFYPKYKDHFTIGKISCYSFNYSCEIMSPETQLLSYLSVPKGAKTN